MVNIDNLNSSYFLSSQIKGKPMIHPSLSELINLLKNEVSHILVMCSGSSFAPH